jgi:hypothetical protein
MSRSVELSFNRFLTLHCIFQGTENSELLVFSFPRLGDSPSTVRLGEEIVWKSRRVIFLLAQWRTMNQGRDVCHRRSSSLGVKFLFS